MRLEYSITPIWELSMYLEMLKTQKTSGKGGIQELLFGKRGKPKDIFPFQKSRIQKLLF